MAKCDEEVGTLGTLYVVSTPIGNLADITLRALDVLREVDLIAAEDTRVTHKLLSKYGIETPTTPYHQHSLGQKTRQLVEALASGKDIALVSDAGTPGVSDPGYELITVAIKNGIRVTCIPGPSAIVTALVVSGLPTRRFAFDGFPPRRKGERMKFIESLKNETRTMLFYESPNRLLDTLQDMLAIWGDRQAAVVREATKKFEEVHRGTLSSAIERFTERKPKGEVTLVVAGALECENHHNASNLDDEIQRLLAMGMSERDVTRDLVARFQIPKRKVYRRILDIKGDPKDD